VEFSIKGGSPQTGASGCLIVGVYEPRKLSRAAADVDRAARGYLASVVRRGDMQGKPGTTLLLHGVPGVTAERVLLVGLGLERDFREKRYREAIAAAVRALNATGADEATLHITELTVGRRDAAWKVAHAVTVASEGGYRFTQMKSKNDGDGPVLHRLVLNVDRAAEKPAAAGLAQGLAVAHGMRLAKDLGNLPPNVCTPSYLASQARELAKRDHRGEYLGVDFSLPLLRDAESQPEDFTAKFIEVDLTRLSPDSDQLSVISNQSLSTDHWSLITAFAVLHHIPSVELRLDILRTVHQLLKPDGIFIHSNWQFLNSEKLKARIQPWEAAAISAADVDTNDYLLDWRSGGAGLRYVHHFAESELQELAKAAEFQIIDVFYSDGETGNLGLYQVWKSAR